MLQGRHVTKMKSAVREPATGGSETAEDCCSTLCIVVIFTLILLDTSRLPAVVDGWIYWLAGFDFCELAI